MQADEGCGARALQRSQHFDAAAHRVLRRRRPDDVAAQDAQRRARLPSPGFGETSRARGVCAQAHMAVGLTHAVSRAALDRAGGHDLIRSPGAGVATPNW